MFDCIRVVSVSIRPLIGEIAMAMVAAVLVIYSSPVNRIVKKITSSMPFVVRVAAFVTVCSLGYAMVSVFCASLVAGLLGRLDNVTLAPAVAVVFLLIGICAERKRYL
jgi:hypothetical protein